MGRGRITPDETIERIKATYAFNGSLKQTSIELGVPIATVSKYVNQESKDQFESVRIEKIAAVIPSIVEMCAQAQRVFLTAMMSEEKIKGADLAQVAVSFGIVTEKALLLTGQATQRTEHVNDPGKLTSDEMEAAARIRAKFSSGGDG